MKKAILPALAAALASLVPAGVRAWSGFDADTSDLVEIEAETVPSKGDTIDVHNLDKDSNVSVLVRDVRLNARTIEMRVTDADKKEHVLVLETP